MDEQTIRSFDGIDWAIVEVMGHNTYAGRISQVVLGSAVMVRVDVPEVPRRKRYGAEYEAVPSFTKMIGANSIYAITPCDEAAAREAAALVRSAAVSVVQLPTGNRAIASADED